MESWFFLLVLLPLMTVITFLLTKKTRKPSKHREPPGPPRLPLIGNLHQFDSLKPQEYLMNLAKIYGPLFSLKLGRWRVLVISSAEMARDALKNNDVSFSGRPSLVCSQKLTYNGLDVGFGRYSEYWREMRKMAVIHLLSMKKVQSFRPIHEDEIAKLLDKIAILSSSSQPMNTVSTIVSLTCSITCRIGFGKTGDIATKGRKNSHQMLEENEHLLGMFFVADYIPWLGWIDRVLGKMGRLERNFLELDAFYEELIEEYQRNPNRSESMKNNILDMMIQLKEDKDSPVELTWSHVKAVITDIFVAGSQSTAATIIWAITALVKNPSTMKRLQTEIREKFRDETKIDAEKLKEIPYLDAVIKEAFRLYTPVPLLLPRETIASSTVGGYVIEPDTLVFVNAWAIGRDPETWENPLEFKPERFIGSDVDVVKGQHFELIPFGSGRRGCPGANLAMATVELVIANLLNFFDWELPPGMKVEDIDTETLPGITMLPKHPLCLVPKKRV